MAIRTRVMAGRGLVVSQGLGVFTLDDLRAHRARVTGHPQYAATMHLLLDLRRVVHFDIDPDGIRNHAGNGSSGARFRRLAVLVDNDLGYGLARMFEALSSDRYGDEILRTFRKPAEAWAWILPAA